MPHSRSAKKRVRQNERLRQRNRSIRSLVKTRIKKLDAALEQEGAAAKAQAALRAACREIDQAVTKGVLHPNTGARYKSRLWRRVNKAAASGAPPAAAAPAKKAPAP